MHRFIAERAQLPIAVVGLLAICLLSSGVTVLRASRPTNTLLPTNGLADLLKDMRPLLPARGVVGYVDGGQNTPAELQDYYLTQYVLAPLVVARSSDENVVIGNFSRSKSVPPDNLVIVRNFGNGIAIFQEKSSLLAKRSH